MPQRVHSHSLAQPGRRTGRTAGAVQRGRVQRMLSVAARKPPVGRPRQSPIAAQDAQQLVKESKKYNAGYPVNETEGDKSKSPKDSKDDGGFGQGNDNGH